MPPKRHFHSFDALRFLAFFKVFVFHLPILGGSVFHYVKAGGGVGVMFFFVLSGFLITHIILEEKGQTGTLHLRNFFIRRILRIWPLYYLMLAVAFLTPYILATLGLEASAAGYTPNWWISLTFLENYRMILLNEAPNVAPLGIMWSICIEEHFYVLWGLAFYALNQRQILPFLLGAVVVAILARGLFWMWGWDSLDLLSNLDLFALGAMPAYFLHRDSQISIPWPKKYMGLGKYGFLVLLLLWILVYPHVSGTWMFVLGPTSLGLVFMGLLCLFLMDPGGLKISDQNYLSVWGKYTYGLYVYHTLVIGLLMQLWPQWSRGFSGWEGLLFGGICFFLSLGISFLSYRLFERPFLRLKRYFY